MLNDISGRSGKVLKKLLIGLGAFLIVLILSTYLFIHFYFQKTFSIQLSGMVIRCSEGIRVKTASGDWMPLKSGQHLSEGTKLQTPPGAQSFLSFDGIRLLSADASEVDITGFRSFSLLKGEVAVAAAKMTKPLRLTQGTSLLLTTDSVLNVENSNGSLCVECVSGGATLQEGKGSACQLAGGQAATISGGKIAIAAVQAQDRFAPFKVSAIERIRDRFNRVISKYAYRHPQSTNGHIASSVRWTGLQFASFPGGGFPAFVQAGSNSSISSYYQTLFVPSNRSISIGKQKVVPLTQDYAASFPIWSHDGSMIAFTEAGVYSWQARVRVVRLDDLNNAWDISQEYDTVLPFFPIAWAPDDKHVLFLVADHMDVGRNGQWWWRGPYHIKIAPVDPSEGKVLDFNSPFQDIPISLPLPVGKTISPCILKLPWGDAMLCGNWGNLAYIPIEPDGQAVPSAPGLFLTNFNPREFFVMGGYWASSGSMIFFTAAEDLDLDNLNTYILYDVEDILDGFAEPPRSPKDPRLKKVAPSRNPQLPGSFSYDESLVFYQEDVNDAWRAMNPAFMLYCDFDLFYADARRDQPSAFTQIHLPGNQIFLQLSPEGNRIAYSNYEHPKYEFRVVSFDIEADMDMDLGGVLIDNSGTNLIVPPGALEKNFKVKISTPFSAKEQAETPTGESHFFAMRLIDAQGVGKPKFVEPMTLTIRYTDDEVAGLDEGMLDIYYYDESDPAHPQWVSLGGTVDPEHNEITAEIQHFSKFSVGGKVTNGQKQEITK